MPAPRRPKVVHPKPNMDPNLKQAFKNTPRTKLESTPEPGSNSEVRVLGSSQFNIPYRWPHNAFQTFDIHSPSAVMPEFGQPIGPPIQDIWVIFIHGGAWRDPLVTSRSALPFVRRLFSDPSIVDHVAAVCSINYSLSPHPIYPHGSFPSDTEDPPNVVGSRAARHPQHIEDVKAAITHLCKLYLVRKYILVGHSCGASLAFHTIMNDICGPHDTSEWARAFPPPDAIAGVAGLYDLPALIHDPGWAHEHIAPLYRAFTVEAFSSNEEVWKQVSPALSCDPSTTWPNGIAILLSAGKNDTLVPYAQLELMHAHLEQRLTRHPALTDLLVENFEGDHNDAWQDGKGVADAVTKLVEVLPKSLKYTFPDDIV